MTNKHTNPNSQTLKDTNKYIDGLSMTQINTHTHTPSPSKYIASKTQTQIDPQRH
jgi:hypothetical protein